ncbi:hypothetical protein DYB32_007434 [Aphanomyces invadans]|uniref:Uncharacterized protein n=1 Tax=Aphanomyces invadans TaxID=157072 RepID=A0A418ANW4_9STRA|nr:hypothetical protein DYB32_007434 [Aphanomyces invadans]
MLSIFSPRRDDMFGSPSSGRRQSVIAEEAGDDDIPGRKPSVSVQPRQKLGATTLSRPQDASTISLMRHGTNNSLRRQTTMNNEASDNVLDDQSMAVLQRDATFRYQKAQIRILQDELASLSETRTKLVRLNEGTEELRALKKELEDEKTNQGGLAVPRHEHERLLNEHQRLEKHKVESSGQSTKVRSWFCRLS